MKQSRIYLGMAVAALAAAACFVSTRTSPAPETAAAPEPAGNLFSFVKSMEGTRPDGTLAESADDTLVVNAELPRLFDYYLAAVGERSLAEIQAEIERELDRRLKPRAAAQAKRLLARYLDYKRDLAEVEKKVQSADADSGLAAIKVRLDAIRQSRLRFFSADEAHAMFGLDDAYDTDNIARLEISQDKSLSEAQRKQKLAALDASMPAELRKERDAPQAIVKLEESVQAIRAQGASDDDIYRMRASALTPEAAARLAEVDRETSAWKSRIANYLAERDRLLNGKSPDADRQAALQQLRDARFSAGEQRRLPAYE